MIKGQDQGYFVYGTVSAGYGECDTKELFNNALFFMDWIKETVENYELAMCKTKLWTQRSSRKWIARMKNGCEQGNLICQKQVCTVDEECQFKTDSPFCLLVCRKCQISIIWPCQTCLVTVF